MSRLAQVKKKKVTPRNQPRNTLDRYFNTPKKILECKPSIVKQENEQPVKNTTRKNNSTNMDVRVKFVKLNEARQKNTQLEESAPHCDQLLHKSCVLLDKIDLSGANNLVNIELQSRITHNISLNRKKNETSSLEIKTNISDHQKENLKRTPERITPLRQSETVTKNVVNRARIVNEALSEVSIESSANDSIEICTVNTPKKRRLSEINCESSKHPIGKSVLPPQEKKKVSATSFKEIIDSFCHSDFSKPYNKLSCYQIPKCCDLAKCRANHEGERPKAVNSFRYGHVFNLLDKPYSEWSQDVTPAITLVMTQEWYLRGDMLRVLLDYILNGPDENLMWDIKTILKSHWCIHPPCTEHMREIYLGLLDRKYPYESFFNTDLNNSGVLRHVLDKMEIVLKSENKNIDEDQTTDADESNVTFEMLEKRFNNHEPLLEKEQQEMMDVVDEFANCSQIRPDLSVLDELEVLNRLTEALEVIIDLFEADFMICVSRLKSFMKGECEVKQPLIKHCIFDNFQSRILKMYVRTTNKFTWKQLSRLIGLMAETFHLFDNSVKRVWKYPSLNTKCEEFASLVFNEFSEGDWDQREQLSRLQTLKPAWLQERVVLQVANSNLNLDLGSGIQGVVDIIHTHVISPVKMEKDLIKIEPDPHKLRMMSEKLMKRAKKKNQYGETLLHQMCNSRYKNFTVEEMECVLALPETDVNAKDHHGWTPLHEAVNSRALAKIELLLQFQPPPGKHEVDVGAQNNDGITPLHEAVETGFLEICQLLVQYGGICLLRKKNNQGVTPLMLAKNKENIRNYFEGVIKTQEELNLNSNSVLKLSDALIRMCMMVCEAFITDHHTWELYQVVKFDKEYVKSSPEPWVTGSSKEVLLKFKQDQDHFRKLRRILEKLAENQENSYLVRIWYERLSIGKGNVEV